MTDRNPTEDAGTHYYIPAPVGESLAAWMQKNQMSRRVVAYRLGVPVKFVDEILTGDVKLDNIAFALGKMVGMTVTATTEEVDAIVRRDNAPGTAPDPVHDQAGPLINRLAAYDAEAKRRTALLDSIVEEDKPLLGRLAGEDDSDGQGSRIKL